MEIYSANTQLECYPINSPRINLFSKLHFLIEPFYSPVKINFSSYDRTIDKTSDSKDPIIISLAFLSSKFHFLIVLSVEHEKRNFESFDIII